jgi:adenylate cyclase
MVFTDIKNSTMLWELHPVAMRSAIKTHNVIMRRQLRIIGGYEVKTEGDAFIVAFPTITLALQWCFAVQTNLLSADWPSEILESEHGNEIYHPERGDLLHRGLSVRMGCHWGTPVCEIDPITKRMDYFGPMMNRTSRISAVADGGQITISADVEAELRALEQLADSVGDINPDDDEYESPLLSIKRDMEALKRTGFAISPIGERKLKGLENSEFIYLIYPNQLIGRLHMDRLKLEGSAPTQNQAEGVHAPIVPGPERIIISDDVRIIPLSDVRLLHMLTYRIEKLCSTNMVSEDSDVLQQRRAHNLREEDSDEVIIQAVESLVTRIEVCSICYIHLTIERCHSSLTEALCLSSFHSRYHS